jgi:hypothetical protein
MMERIYEAVPSMIGWLKDDSGAKKSKVLSKLSTHSALKFLV